MALYEYSCDNCGNVFEKRMPMSEVKQRLKCPSCGKQAKKVLGSFAFVSSSSGGIGDGPAPWDDDGGMGMPDMGGMGMPDMGGMGMPGMGGGDFDFGDDDF